MADRLIVLTGPTAVGKTKLSVALAKRIGGEIISADSMQVYRRMDIGTDKIRPEDMRGVPHHLIDVLEPTEPFNVTRFQQMALRAMEEIRARGRVPILAGGTGFYIQSVLYRIDFTETDDDPSIRLAYEKQLREGGEEALRALYARLREADPVSAKRIPMQNAKRVIRALEFFDKTGTPISSHNDRERMKRSPYDFRYFVLTDDREKLYANINARVDRMMEKGLLDEVIRLRREGVTADMTSMQGLGYREIGAYLDGAYGLEQAVHLIRQNTRHFAKRQLTWFRRERDVIWLDKREYDHDDERILERMIALYEQQEGELT
ncbi:MAG: tRNA (adenosine(37)-N6)-dimethylallyltransferase MiaA [Lachnospiraceae bacterium]|nr:tRNA (adenosine(37)-N6)-dimethylallyltransferase MiaA [Lachnospiraceae bacterium]